MGANAIIFVSGMVPILAFLGVIAASLRKTNSLIERFMIEHEMLISWYCDEKGISLERLPTRTKGPRRP